METDNYRITKLLNYLVEVVDAIETSRGFNVDRLPKEVATYSLDKIPTDIPVEIWITGLEIHKDVFSFRSRRNYTYDEINNLKNIGFFEKFEQLIFDNNKKGIMPQIDGIERIECLNCGTLSNADNNTAEFNIQIQITYRIGG